MIFDIIEIIIIYLCQIHKKEVKKVLINRKVYDKMVLIKGEKMNYNFVLKDLTMSQSSKNDVLLKKIKKDINDLVNKYGNDVNNNLFDGIFEEAFILGGKHYVSLISDLFKNSDVPVKNPLYIIIDDKLYKRIEN